MLRRALPFRGWALPPGPIKDATFRPKSAFFQGPKTLFHKNWRSSAFLSPFFKKNTWLNAEQPPRHGAHTQSPPWCKRNGTLGKIRPEGPPQSARPRAERGAKMPFFSPKKSKKIQFLRWVLGCFGPLPSVPFADLSSVSPLFRGRWVRGSLWAGGATLWAQFLAR